MKSKPVEVAMLPLVAGDLATVALLVWMMMMMMMLMKIIIIVVIIIMLLPDAVDAAVYDAGEGPGVEADDNLTSVRAQKILVMAEMMMAMVGTVNTHLALPVALTVIAPLRLQLRADCCGCSCGCAHDCTLCRLRRLHFVV